VAEKKRLGDWGEDAVAKSLSQQGYIVQERQYHCRWGEIDIIACSPDGVLCFVEVKTRSNTSFSQARESVTATKQQKLRTAAGCYLAEQELDCPCRFDVAEVYPSSMVQRSPTIHYIINAF